MKNSTRNASASTEAITHYCQSTPVQKNWMQEVSPYACIVTAAVHRLKGMSWAKATSSSEEIKLKALSIIKLCLGEGIDYLVR